MSGGGVVGGVWMALKEVFYGDVFECLFLVDYDIFMCYL